MALQNRVTPFGDIIATPARGMFTGNRGILHEPEGRRLSNRRWTTSSWLVCVCDYRGVRREVMTGRKWTELFFLDEATALAAGHRPCFLCRRDAAERFRRLWAGDGIVPTAKAMDARLHRERLDGRSKRLHTLPPETPAIGTMASGAGEAWLWANDWLRWTPHGYEPGKPARLDGMLTPPSTYAALQAGYRPALHPSAAQTGERQ